MNNILNSIKLDYYILKSSDFRRMGLIAAIALFAGFASKDPLLVLGIVMMTSGFLMSTIFAVVEKNNLGKLYGILPVKKQETVIGRYVFAFLAGLAIAAVATILSFVISFFLNMPIGGFTLLLWLSGSFLLFSVLIAFQFPLYFKYDFSKMAAFANLPYIIVVVAGVFLAKKDPALFSHAAKFFMQNPNMLWIIAIVASLLLLAVSTVISIVLYKKREL